VRQAVRHLKTISRRDISLIGILIFIILLIALPAHSLRYTSEEALAEAQAGFNMPEPRLSAATGGAPSVAISGEESARVIERQYYQPENPVMIKKRIYIKGGFPSPSSDDGISPRRSPNRIR